MTELELAHAALCKIRDEAGFRAGSKPFKDVDPFIGYAFRTAVDALPGGETWCAATQTGEES